MTIIDSFFQYKVLYANGYIWLYSSHFLIKLNATTLATISTIDILTPLASAEGGEIVLYANKFYIIDRAWTNLPPADHFWYVTVFSAIDGSLIDQHQFFDAARVHCETPGSAPGLSGEFPYSFVDGALLIHRGTELVTPWETQPRQVIYKFDLATGEQTVLYFNKRVSRYPQGAIAGEMAWGHGTSLALESSWGRSASLPFNYVFSLGYRNSNNPLQPGVGYTVVGAEVYEAATANIKNYAEAIFTRNAVVTASPAHNATDFPAAYALDVTFMLPGRFLGVAYSDAENGVGPGGADLFADVSDACAARIELWSVRKYEDENELSHDVDSLQRHVIQTEFYGFGVNFGNHFGGLT